MDIQSNRMTVEMQAQAVKKNQNTGTEIAIETIGSMNQDKDSFRNPDYEFQKDVLFAATGRGTMLDVFA